MTDANERLSRQHRLRSSHLRAKYLLLLFEVLSSAVLSAFPRKIRRYFLLAAYLCEFGPQDLTHRVRLILAVCRSLRQTANDGALWVGSCGPHLRRQSGKMMERSIKPEGGEGRSKPLGTREKSGKRRTGTEDNTRLTRAKYRPVYIPD